MIPEGLETAFEFLCYCAGAHFAVKALVAWIGFIFGRGDK
jgi:hypothetical protein